MSASSSPVATYRNMINGEPQWGQGQANFVADVYAIALLLQTRLNLFMGEWWANLTDGLPLWQSILGQNSNVAAISLLISQRILATPYVVGIINSSAVYANSQFSYTATVQTQFGPVTVTNSGPTFLTQSLQTP
jgi:hypothetical protein